ncbi:MAG: hypothetical protein ACUVQY_08360 [Thermoproteota archaeon]
MIFKINWVSYLNCPMDDVETCNSISVSIITIFDAFEIRHSSPVVSIDVSPFLAY